METLLMGLGVLALTIPLNDLTTILRGYVLTILWAWFIIPTFPSMPVLHVVPALGISLMINYLCKDGNLDKNEDEDKWVAFSKAIILAIAKPFMVLGIAWIVHLWM